MCATNIDLNCYECQNAMKIMLATSVKSYLKACVLEILSLSHYKCVANIKGTMKKEEEVFAKEWDISIVQGCT